MSGASRADRWWGRRAARRGRSSARHFVPQRRALFAGLRGSVLEIGAGVGANFGHLPDGVRWIGLEPNTYLVEPLRRNAVGHGPVLRGTVERIPLADASVDAVIGTFVLCSVVDLERALAEIIRVLRPGGQFVYLEHVAAPAGTWSRRAQRAIAPASRRFDGGCDPVRETGRAIEAAGFATVDADVTPFPVLFGLTTPLLAGSAVKPA